ncbi:hypothetical protein [Cryptosporangium sp. NPDC051539]|uniref:hypothetical protein n=1 Tax=Cryptosporangium sp. NPDC051539 TaxID=3363962 RepID=UPI0037B9BB43
MTEHQPELFGLPVEPPSREARPAVPRPRRPPQSGRCRWCHGTILWAPTEASAGTRIMPLDIDVTEDGLCVLVAAADGTGNPWVRVLGRSRPIPPELADFDRRTAHQYSCPGGSWQAKRKIGP